MDFYNVMRDPGEKLGELYPRLFAVTSIQITLREHMKMIQKFPHRVSEVTPKGSELTPHGQHHIKSVAGDGAGAPPLNRSVSLPCAICRPQTT